MRDVLMGALRMRFGNASDSNISHGKTPNLLAGATSVIYDQTNSSCSWLKRWPSRGHDESVIYKYTVP